LKRASSIGLLHPLSFSRKYFHGEPWVLDKQVWLVGFCLCELQSKSCTGIET
jgi:hypothetical protein